MATLPSLHEHARQIAVFGLAQLCRELTDLHDCDKARGAFASDNYLFGKLLNGLSFVYQRRFFGREPQAVWADRLGRLLEMPRPPLGAGWGVLFYLMGLHRAVNITDPHLESLVRRQIAELKNVLDWRELMIPGSLCLLPGVPTNFLAVAASIACYRYKLGWEGAEIIHALLAELGKCGSQDALVDGLLDDSCGHGRYDRYSLLVPAELTDVFVDCGLRPPDAVLAGLRCSGEIVLSLRNASGHGIPYGRSIGAYGDSAVFQILAMAVRFNLVSDTELALAYCHAILDKFEAFWIDGKTGLIDLWGKGRQPDPYRHAGRSFGESLTLYWQLLQFSARLVEAEVRQPKVLMPPVSVSVVEKHVFTLGPLERSLVVVRRDSRVFTLPFVSGGAGSATIGSETLFYYAASPYLPIPYAVQLLEVSALQLMPQLMPRIVLKDGTVLLGVHYFSDIVAEAKGSTIIVRYRQKSYSCLEKEEPTPDERFSSEVCYRFCSGEIERHERITGRIKDILRIEMIFSTFSTNALVTDEGVIFGAGPVTHFKVSGLTVRQTRSLTPGPDTSTTHGSLRTSVDLLRESFESVDTYSITWRLGYA